MEIALPMGRLKMLEEQGEVELHTSLHLDDDRSTTGMNVTKTEIITGLPDRKFTNV